MEKNMVRNRSRRAVSAFTLIELLVVIAIISILAAILFPVFATVRETTRQSSTMSSMHSVYLGARLFYEDEGRYPSSLFGYAEVSLQSPPYDPTQPLARPAIPTDPLAKIVPMDQATGSFSTNFASTGRSLNKGYLYREQIKDFSTFINPEAPETHNQTAPGQGKQAITTVYTPTTLPTLLDGTVLGNQQVVWTGTANASPGVCGISGDTDLPSAPGYLGLAKVYYKMDSMDIGPRIDLTNGKAVLDAAGNVVYELHYSPDWTRERYDPVNQCDEYKDIKNNIYNIPQQLKYKSPPTERTILTYITDHVAFGGSKNVLILLMSGTARTLDYKKALDTTNSNYTLPFNYH